MSGVNREAVESALVQALFPFDMAQAVDALMDTLDNIYADEWGDSDDDEWEDD